MADLFDAYSDTLERLKMKNRLEPRTAFSPGYITYTGRYVWENYSRGYPFKKREHKIKSQTVHVGKECYKTVWRYGVARSDEQ